MAWWTRVLPAPPAETRADQAEAARAEKELAQANFEADVALETVKIQNATKRNIRKIIEEIRKENHFVEIWKGREAGA